MLFRDVIGPFLVHCRVERNYATETQAKVHECIRAWLLPHLGDFHVEKISALQVLSLREKMTERKLSNSRQSSVLVALKAFLQFCQTVLQLDCLNADSIKLPPRTFRPVQYLTNEEVAGIRRTVGSLTTTALRLRALFELLLTTGMRISECLSLDRDSIDRRKLEAVIIGKGSRSRVVFFSAEALAHLDRYLNDRHDLNPALFVTTGRNPTRLRRGDIPRYFKALGQAAGIKKHFTPHLLRHTFCTNLRNNGADISVIKDLAGHADIQTTARYYLASDKEVLHEAVRKHLNYDTPSLTAVPRAGS